MLMTEAAQYRRFQAPQDDGQTLVEPSAPRLAELVARNRRHLAGISYDVQGRPLADLAVAARRSLVAAAIGYTSQYRDLPPEFSARAEIHLDPPLLFTGHQPQLFHPGVWFKNFLLGRLAKEVCGLGVHLLIDSDICRSTSIRVPTGTIERPLVDVVPLDRSADAVPFEERAVADEATFASFARRAAELIEPLVDRPVALELWPLIQRRSHAEPNLGLRLAQGRHALEAQWGNATLELPQSAVCRLPEFHWFVAHVLAHLPRFWAAHNDALAAYRQEHRLRNRAQPVPDLAESEGWLEAPFWIWSGDEPQRRAMFARQQGDELIITDRSRQTVVLALSADQEATAAAEQLAELAVRGVKIRTRALATTLFARLLLGDLFIHGIGGAKYDQVSDQIAEQFFGFSLPEFATASATLRLPIDHPDVPAGEWRAVQRQLRDLDHHPERFLPVDGVPPGDQTAGVASIIAEKRLWIDTPTTSANARDRHLAIAAANAALQPHLAAYRRQLLEQRDELDSRRRAADILNSREYSFCLFPREHLQRCLLDDMASTP